MHSHCTHPKFRCIDTARQYAIRERALHFDFKLGFASAVYRPPGITCVLCIAATAGDSASIAGAVLHGILAGTRCAPAVNVALCLSLTTRPCSCMEMHPATRELERVYNESESSSNSRVDGSRFRLALSNDPPLSCHSAPLGLSLITSLSSRYLLLSSHPPIQPSLPRPPPTSTTAPIRAASGVTLNSGPAAMCPTTRADVDKARTMHEAKSKENLARRISPGKSRWRSRFVAANASNCHLLPFRTKQ